jgi:branched-chain amino acid transport system substrate-binding protein
MKKLAAISVVVLLLAVAVLAAAFGAAKSQAKPTSKATVIRVGHIVDKTGPEATVGSKFDIALNAANEYFGNIAGKQIQVITYDAAGTTSGAVNAAKKLVTSDHVVAILGPTQQGQKVAVANYIKTKAHIPLIMYNPTTPSVYKNNPWVIAAGGSSYMQGSADGAYARTVLKWKTAVLMTKDTEGNRAFCSPATAWFTKHGGKIVKSIYVPESGGDYSSYLAGVPAADGMFAWVQGSDAMTWWQAFYTNGVQNKMKVTAPFTGGFLDSFIVMGVPVPVRKDAIAGTTGATMYDPNAATPANTAFKSTVQPKLAAGYSPDQTMSASWEGYMVFKSGLEAAKGKTTAKALKAGLLKGKTVGPEGPVSFHKSNVATRTVYILQIKPKPGTPAAANVYYQEAVRTYKMVGPLGLK